jgi:polyhydroxybutyrate depolymerase
MRANQQRRPRRHGPVAAALLTALVLVASLGACTGRGRPTVMVPDPPITAGGTYDLSLHEAGVERTFRLHVPAALPTGPVPLLVALHGGGGSGRRFEQQTGFDGLADRDGFLVAYPDGTGAGPAGGALRTWDAGTCCGPAARDGVDDVTFVRHLISFVQGTRPVDADRVYVVGHSNGGMLAYRVACELSDVVAAVALQSGALLVPDCHPSRPVPLLHVHGTADHNVPYDGGVGKSGVTHLDFPSVQQSLAAFTAADGCAGAPSTATDVGDPDLVRTTWRCGPDGRAPVQLLTVRGAEHAWMGHPAPRSVPDNVPYQGLDATATTWAFLAAQHR